MNARTASCLLVLAMLTHGLGCGVKPVLLSPAPTMYEGGAVEPFSRVHPNERTTSMDVLYATDRRPVVGDEGVRFSNQRTHDLHVGTATVRFGDDELTWDGLVDASLAAPRPDDMALHLDAVAPHAQVSGDAYGPVLPIHTPALLTFSQQINDLLAVADDRDIMLYVHGAKVDFYNSCAMTADLGHFAGRDFVSMAYAWGTHQNIFAYAWGSDLEESWNAGDKLSSLLLFLADHTDADRVNLVGYSAGARVVREALLALRHRFAELSGPELRSRLRLGVVFLAAPDVPLTTFARDVRMLQSTADRVIVTMSDADSALRMAEIMMRHESRAGQASPEVIDTLETATVNLDRLELIDVSYGQEQRGFDIRGHHYWHEHPWVLSDVILALRTRAPAEQRGLTATPMPRVWCFSADYESRVRDAVRKLLPADTVRSNEAAVRARHVGPRAASGSTDP